MQEASQLLGDWDLREYPDQEDPSEICCLTVLTVWCKETGRLLEGASRPGGAVTLPLLSSMYCLVQGDRAAAGDLDSHGVR